MLIFIYFKIKYLNVFFSFIVREFNEIIHGMQKEFSTLITIPCQWREPQTWLGIPSCQIASLLYHKGLFLVGGDLEQ